MDAALELFFAKGYGATSIREIAERVEVSAQTVYNAFGDKEGLLRAAADRWFTGSDDAMPLAETATGRRLLAEPDLRARIALATEFALDTYARGDIRAVIDGAIAADPDLADLADWAMEHSYTNTRALMDLVIQDEVSDSEIREDLMDLLWAVFNSEAMRRLLGHRGWSRQKTSQWLVELTGRLVEQATRR